MEALKFDYIKQNKVLTIKLLFWSVKIFLFNIIRICKKSNQLIIYTHINYYISIIWKILIIQREKHNIRT